jgi:hypothetical protein
MRVAGGPGVPVSTLCVRLETRNLLHSSVYLLGSGIRQTLDDTIWAADVLGTEQQTACGGSQYASKAA